MRLAELLRACDVQAPSALASTEVTGISYDSRTVAPGNVFVAIAGFHVNGAAFVREALSRGAVAALIESATGFMPGDLDPRRLISVGSTRRALAVLAAAWYGYPARELVCIGITGTDGKTSTSYLTASVLEAGGLRSGLFTTVAYKVGSTWEENDSRQTTPEAPAVQQLLRRMVRDGCTHAVLESTSHGLELHKLDFCEYDVAVFTNLSPDHLDFHGTVDAYRRAKSRLFEMLDTSLPKGLEKTAVLNADDPSAAIMAAATKARPLWYGIDADADVRATEITSAANGTQLTLCTPAGDADLFLPLPGLFNVYNALAATAAGLTVGVSLQDAVTGLSQATAVPGRMQPIDEGQAFAVIVDYAHTAASFEKVLATMRPLVTGRIITVFGCAGERGVERRTGMGRIAARDADYTVITSEDPRLEDPDAIIAQIAAAMTANGADEGRLFERVADRHAAIRRAFSLAEPGDLVLLTGKGHEHSIEMASGRVAWDEAAVARELLRGG